MFGRVADGMTPDQARAELTTILGAWTLSDGADEYKRYTVFRFTPLTGLPDDARRALLGFGGLLLGAAILVLIVAGANVSRCWRCVQPRGATKWVCARHWAPAGVNWFDK
jgi:hypothetical protein